MKRQKVFMLLGWLTLIVFSAVGLILIHFIQKQSLYELFFQPFFWPWQLLIGLGIGYLSARLALVVINSPFLSKTNQYYTNLIRQFKLTPFKIIFISFCAGVGEEILFRGAIQFWLGIIITAVLFVAIHGYLNPMDWRLSIYGLFMTLVMVVIGYMSTYLGLISSIAAHFMIDFVLLLKLYKDDDSVTIDGNYVEKIDSTMPLEEN